MQHRKRPQICFLQNLGKRIRKLTKCVGNGEDKKK
ncbi:hypothetical protein BDFB_012642 [Asbolus verrucosus]|uniref:Uncharacterized protein n=1 Tax=Asbolus verrucosus TaxID=1661398 RepID=A0A482W8X6_ASBVE|nr:hypothetical protein BDFB_012642 [Asbolus verrucosus]